MIKILFVTYDFPFPPTSGGKSRAYNLIKYSKDKNISIDVLSFVRGDFDKSWEEELKKIGIKDIRTYKRKKLKSTITLSKNLISSGSIFKTLYYDKEFLKLIKQMVKENAIDIVHFESSYTGYYIGEELRKMNVKQILGTENIEYMLYEEYIKNSKNIIKKPVLSYQIKRFKKEEEEMMRRADLSLAVTKDEADYIKKISGKKCEVIENAVSLKDLKFKFSEENKNNLLFVGNFTYIPNIKAIKYFINDVFPKFEKNITLTVVGKKVEQYVEDDERIIRKEFVKDLIEEYRKADALIFPIKIGGGTNFKILEAMALGVPVLGFADKIQSTGAIPNKEFFEAKNADEFVKEFGKIQKDKNEVKKVVENARELIEKRYSWETVGQKLNKIWLGLKK